MRETARICRIADLLSGTYIVKEGWEPNYVETAIGRISRTNLMGTVIGIEDRQSFLLDDGTGSIRVRRFEGEHSAIIGEPVLVIGRPRRYNDQLFLAPEVVKRIDNPGWLDYRKRELELLRLPEAMQKEKTPENLIEDHTSALDALPDPYEKILQRIRELDSGEGAAIDLISNDEETEKRLNRLIEEGRVFSNRAGFVKIL